MVFTTSCISGSESVSSVSEDRKGSTSPKSDMMREGIALADDEDDVVNDDYQNLHCIQIPS